MKRYENIIEKLDYAEEQRQTLMNLVFDAKVKRVEIKKIKHILGDILSSCRECYDYCGKDIIESQILSKTTDQELIDKYTQNKLNTYFPLYINQINGKKKIFHSLEQFNRPLYNHLIDLTKKISDGDVILNTLFNYKDIEKLKDIVNNKKHNDVIGIKNIEKQEMIFKNKEMQIVLPIKSQKGIKSLVVPKGTSVELVDEFIFEDNQMEITFFAMTATKSTRLILEEIYRDYLK